MTSADKPFCLVVIAGATGLIGSSLTNALISEGFAVLALSRTKNKIPSSAPPNLIFMTYEEALRLKEQDLLKKHLILTTGLKPPAATDIDNDLHKDPQKNFLYVLINLAGTSLGSKRLTAKRLNEAIASRNQITAILQKLFPAPLAYFQGSGYLAYDCNPSSKDILQKLPLSIESYAVKCFLHSCVCALRFGLVLAPHALLVKKLKKLPGIFFLDGSNIIPYIELDEAVTKIMCLINKAFAGQTLPCDILIASKQKLSLNDLLFKIQGRKLRLPALRFLLRFYDLRGRLLDYDIKD